MRTPMLLAALVLTSSAAGADTLFDGGHINRDDAHNNNRQAYFEKAADRFGNCVMKRQATAAESFVDQTSADVGASKSPELVDAVKACLPARSHSTYSFIVREQDTAIRRAVSRSSRL